MLSFAATGSTMLSFAVHWVVNNQEHVQHLQSQHHMYKLATDKAWWLQQSAASLIGAKPESFKVVLNAPCEPRLTLTPALQTLSTARPALQHWVVDEVREAWAKLEAASDKVINVNVKPLTTEDVQDDETVRVNTVVKSLALYWVGSNTVISKKLEYFQCEYAELYRGKAFWLQS